MGKKKTSEAKGHTTDDATRNADDFKQEVLAELESRHSNSGAGLVGAFNPAAFLGRLDAFVQKVQPLLPALAPAQYALLVQAVAALIHAGNGLVNPAQ